MYAGDGETCLTPYTKINCQEGLKCILISTTPHVNGICLKEGSAIEEDYINRKENYIKNQTLTEEYVYSE